MRRNCDLKLCLQPSSFGYLPSSSASEDQNQHHHHHHHHRSLSNPTMEGESPDQQHHQQLMTIFYNGQVCVCDVNYLQARAILSLASKESEEIQYESPITSPSPWLLTSPSPSPSPTTPVVYNPSPKEAVVSMKRSLQRFLQKRRNRFQATSPYHH